MIRLLSLIPISGSVVYASVFGLGAYALVELGVQALSAQREWVSWPHSAPSTEVDIQEGHFFWFRCTNKSKWLDNHSSLLSSQTPPQGIYSCRHYTLNFFLVNKSQLFAPDIPGAPPPPRPGLIKVSHCYLNAKAESQHLPKVNVEVKVWHFIFKVRGHLPITASSLLDILFIRPNGSC